MTYEVQLENWKKNEQQQPKKKNLTFNASSDTEGSDEEEDDIAMISRKFKKILETSSKNIMILMIHLYVLNVINQATWKKIALH